MNTYARYTFIALALAVGLIPLSATAHDLRLSAAFSAAFPVSNSNSINVGGGYAVSVDIPLNNYEDHVWLGFQGSHMPLESTESDLTLQMLAAGVNVSLVREHATFMPYVVGGVGVNVDGWSAAYWMLGIGAEYTVTPSLQVFGEVVPLVQFDPSTIPLLSARMGVRYVIGS